MNKVQQSIYDNIVGPAVDSIAGSVIGEVVDYNNKLNMATVTYSSGDPDDEEEDIVRTGVPYGISPGIKKTGLFPGDRVIIQFMNNSYKHPYISELIDRNFPFDTRPSMMTHYRKGSNVTDYYSDREGESW